MQARGAWLILMSVSGLGWAAMTLLGHPFLAPPNCGVGAPTIGDGWRNLQAGLLLNGVDRLAGGWAVMILAMTPAALGPALASRGGARPGGFALFAAGYAIAWLLAGAALIPAALWIAGMVPDPRAALTVMGATALAWRLGPFHRLAAGSRRSSASETTGREHALAGCRHGGACVLTCWPLMLAPLVIHQNHLALMLAATALQWADHVRAWSSVRRLVQAARTGKAFRTASPPLRGHPHVG